MGAPQYEQAGADIGGTGTTNTIPRWTGPSTLGDSGLIDNGTAVYTTTRNVGFGTASPSTRLHVSDNSSIPVIVQSSGSTDSYLRFINTSNNLGYIGYVGTNLYLAPNNGAGNVGIGTASPAAKLHASFADATVGTLLSGATKAVRFVATATQMSIDGIDNTGLAGFQQLQINGLPLLLATAGVERARIDSAGNLLMAGNGTAANPIIANSTGVSGMYFPSATTVAIAANGSIAATFSKVAGAGVALGGTTGLVFDASGSQQGVKLRATPDSTDTQTLDCYQDGGSTAGGASFAGSITLSAAATWGGTQPTITSAKYTRVGNLVFCTVVLSGAALTSTYGTTTLTIATLPTPAANTAVPMSASGTSGVGVESTAGTLFLPAITVATTEFRLSWFYAV